MEIRQGALVAAEWTWTVSFVGGQTSSMTFIVE